MFTHKGSSLIEIIISLFILSILLLGLDATQLLSLRQAKSAYYFTVATQQLKSMAERLKVINEGDYPESLSKWNQQNQEVLPQGKGVLSGLYPTYTLSIFWGSQPQSTCNKKQIGQSGCLYLNINM